MKIVTTYKADNGDEFVRIENPNVPQENVTSGEVRCIAKERKEPVEHLSYYTEDGDFIGTAGTHIHKEVGTLTEYVYTKRVSEKTENDTITETLGYDEV